MDGNYLARPLVFLVQVVFGAYTLIVLLRFILQWVRADFYNPMSQFIVKATTPVLRPMRRVIPSFRGLDTASILLAWALKTVEVMVVVVLLGGGLHPFGALLWAIPELISLVIDLYTFGILILVIFSWINTGGYNPAVVLIERVVAPIMRPIQSAMPNTGGIDFSPMVAMVGLVILRMLLIPPLQYAFGSPLG